MDEVSLNTNKGRIRMPITIGKVIKHKIFYLMVSVDIPEQPSIEAKNVIGVDMGIATT